MGIFGKNKVVPMNVIRCDEKDYLIWKWSPAGSDGKRENAIRWGSSLRVRDGEVAAFFCSQGGKTSIDYIVGPFDAILKTHNLPGIASIVGLAYGGDSPFPAEVYFINLAKIVQVRFGVPFFDVFDPRFSDFGVPVAVRGTITFQITEYREFIKLHRLENFSLAEFQTQIRDVVCRYVKDVVANAPAANNIPVVQLESKTAQINDAIEYTLSQRLMEDFGVTVSGVDISVIEIDKTSQGYQQLKAVTQDMTTAQVQAQTENYIETLRIQREEAQYSQRKQTETANFAAYQVEKQAEVGVAGANALGQMGSNGSVGVNLGGGAGFNPAGVMAGMAVGGTIGQNLAGTMNGMMSGVNQPVQPGAIPPPVPTAAYHVAVNGQATGPYEIGTLAQMVSSGQIKVDTLVWKPGMSQWVKVGDVDELKALFPNIPPVPPVE